MNYCLNPNCQNPQNQPGRKLCQSCGKTLLLGDRYHLIKQMGQGGFGRTFLAIAKSEPSKPRCVIKQVFPQGIYSRKAAELFQQEAARLEELGKHPQIPKLLAYFEQDSFQYLVQEFIDGQNFAEELAQKGRFSEAQILYLLKELLPILQFVHERQTIHRDIKPENLIRRHGDGKLFLVDFSAAKFATDTALLRTGTVIGSARYVAPEQATGKAVFASDIYSLGVTCLHLLTQIEPFDLYSVSSEAWVWRDYLNNSASDFLGAILDKMLEEFTHRRYKTAADVLKELKAASPSVRENGIAIASSPIISEQPQLAATARAIIVAKFGSADYQTISEAIQSAQPGTRILVRSGFYQESLVIDKPLEIIGDGAVTIASLDSSCISMETDNAVVRGFSLIGEGERQGNKTSLVKLLKGCLILQDCDITSDSGSCIGIHSKIANPVIQRCQIHNGSSNGVWFGENSRGIVEDCDIFSNAGSGVYISKGANPVIRQCKIHDGKQNGIWITENSRGIVEDCDIFGHTYSEVAIDRGSNPTIRRCKIHDGQGNGLRITENSQGIVEDCDIFGNAYPEVVIDKGGNPTIRRCKIYEGQGNGIHVTRNGRGIVEDCDIFGNVYSGVYIETDGNPTIRRCKIYQHDWGVCVKSHGAGTFENCDLTGNQRGAWSIEEGCSVRRSGNKEREGIGKGFWRFIGLS